MIRGGWVVCEICSIVRGDNDTYKPLRVIDIKLILVFQYLIVAFSFKKSPQNVAWGLPTLRGPVYICKELLVSDDILNNQQSSYPPNVETMKTNRGWVASTRFNQFHKLVEQYINKCFIVYLGEGCFPILGIIEKNSWCASWLQTWTSWECF